MNQIPRPLPPGQSPLRISHSAWVFAIFAIFAHPSARAATYTWDVTPGNSTVEEGAGTWAGGSANWYNGSLYDQNWADGNVNWAVFGAVGGNNAVPSPGSGTGGVVMVNGTVAPLGLAFRTPVGGGGYTLTGGQINLGSGGIPEIGGNNSPGGYNSGTTTLNTPIALQASGGWTFGPLNNAATDGAVGKYRLNLNGALTGNFTPSTNTKGGYNKDSVGAVPLGTWVTLSSAGNSLLGFNNGNQTKFTLDNSVAASPSLTLGASGFTLNGGAAIADINNATLTINNSGPLTVSTGSNSSVGNNALLVRGTSVVTLNGGEIRVAAGTNGQTGYADISGSAQVSGAFNFPLIC